MYAQRTVSEWLDEIARIAQSRGLAGDGCYIPTGEPLGFSWSKCDVCGSKHGGERFSVSADFGRRGQIDIQDVGECCADCLCYLANGELPE